MAEKKKPGRPKKKSNAGRPTVMTEETLKKLTFAFSKGLSDEEASLFAEITPQTLYNYCHANPEFFERKELLKNKPKMQAKLNISENIENGDVDTSKWYLERKAKNEFSTKQETAIEGAVPVVISGADELVD